MKTIFVYLTTLVFLGSGLAYAEVNYTNSAHGSSTTTGNYGVHRTGTNQYVRGNCAHCHEQHASINGAEPAPNVSSSPSDAGPDKFCLLGNNFTGVTAGPYDQADNACFWCHTNSGYVQSNLIVNNNYAATFGGADAATTGIMQAFNSTSYHNLKDVIDYADSIGTWPFTADSNPCSACHNVHIAKRNKANQGNPAYAAISKPSAHDSLWGDDTDPNERMTVYGTGASPPHYQPPYDADDTNLEPDGAGTDRATQAGKTPDYNTFCLDCHQNEVPSSKTSVNPNTTSGYLTAIDWSSEKHGTADADTDIRVDLPYSVGSGSLGYVLSCLDCHEPHGSPNAFLIRDSVNGGALSGTVGTGLKDYGHLCRQCHIDDYDTGHAYGVANRWESVHHCANDYPYGQSSCSGSDCHPGGGKKIVCGFQTSGPPTAHICSDCHYHGSSKSGRTTF
ncbi:MAG: cytochrome c3 family protein [Deltaproteobacteria bacterium]|nr:cytochrome c3 family protein [Deltaproteobacteria bacterium]MBW1796326.1 cytochrome c3 family protein [Deltaproteobacteria bacterium]